MICPIVVKGMSQVGVLHTVKRTKITKISAEINQSQVNVVGQYTDRFVLIIKEKSSMKKVNCLPTG